MKVERKLFFHDGLKTVTKEVSVGFGPFKKTVQKKESVFQSLDEVLEQVASFLNNLAPNAIISVSESKTYAEGFLFTEVVVWYRTE